MYISELVDKYGYTIIYKKDKKELYPYWGVDTQNRNIFLFNIEIKEYKTIEYYLKQADKQYLCIYKTGGIDDKV